VSLQLELRETARGGLGLTLACQDEAEALLKLLIAAGAKASLL